MALATLDDLICQRRRRPARLRTRRPERPHQERQGRRRHAHPRDATDAPPAARSRARGSCSRRISDGRRARSTRSYSLAPVAKRLGSLLEARRSRSRRNASAPRRNRPSRISPRAPSCCSRTCASTRRRRRTTRPSPRRWPSLADVYVNDAFGTAHRAHASTVGMVSLVKEAGAGDLLCAELDHLRRILDPARPFLCLLGGAKVSDKLTVLEAMVKRADVVCVGGAMAYTFLAAHGKPVGASLVEADRIDDAKRVLAAAKTGRAQADAADRSRRRREAGSRRRVEDRDEDPGRLDGARHRPEDGEGVRQGVCACEDDLLERPDGRLRDRRLRQGHRGGRATRWRTRRRCRWSAAATRSPRSTSSGSPSASPTVRRAAARRSSSSKAARCPAWSRWRSTLEGADPRRQLEDAQDDRRVGRVRRRRSLPLVAGVTHAEIVIAPPFPALSRGRDRAARHARRARRTERAPREAGSLHWRGVAADARRRRLPLRDRRPQRTAPRLRRVERVRRAEGHCPARARRAADRVRGRNARRARGRAHLRGARGPARRQPRGTHRRRRPPTW